MNFTVRVKRVEKLLEGRVRRLETIESENEGVRQECRGLLERGGCRWRGKHHLGRTGMREELAMVRCEVVDGEHFQKVTDHFRSEELVGRRRVDHGECITETVFQEKTT